MKQISKKFKGLKSYRSILWLQWIKLEIREMGHKKLSLLNVWFKMLLTAFSDQILGQQSKQIQIQQELTLFPQQSPRLCLSHVN